MQPKDIIGKTITDIYECVVMEMGGLDTGECFILLDDERLVGMAFGPETNIEVTPNAEAISLREAVPNAPYIGRKIVDLIWYEDGVDYGFYLLDNGYLVTETLIAPHGTGLAGLNIYASLEALIAAHGSDYQSLTKTRK